MSELRARCTWPAMLVLGIVVALVFSLQMDLLLDQKQRVVGGLLWLAIFFAGMTAVDRSFAVEHEEGCWQGMKLLPVGTSTLFLAKWVVNVLALWGLAGILIPLFFVLGELPLREHIGPLMIVAALACPGMAAVGTLVSALAIDSGRGGSPLVLVVLPLVIPVVLGAAECTRLVVQGHLDESWWHGSRCSARSP